MFAQVNYVVTPYDGSTTTYRALAYYRLADGEIVVNDVMTVPDMFQVLGADGSAAWGTVLNGSRALFRPAPRHALCGWKWGGCQEHLHKAT